ncbi:MAG: hypothetical protein LBK59_01100, partial [Bifidobacteriaceae bacterium]|nr:hypothetical protein [Bifidobacteriaceae bacterium]
GIYTATERQRQVETGSYEELPADDGGMSQGLEIEAPAVPAPVAPSVPSPPLPPVRTAHSSAELMEALEGREADAPICMTCGIKMRPSGSCHVCEGCGSTSGCS